MHIITKTLLIGLIIFHCFGFSNNITVCSDDTFKSNIQNSVTLDAPTIEINFVGLSTLDTLPEYINPADALSGVLTLSDITNGFTNNNENFYEAGGESAQYESDYGTAWNNFIVTWNVLGLGGLAQTNGVQFNFTDVSPHREDF